jgi:membrane protein implicated in regulation of membrane protease activity
MWLVWFIVPLVIVMVIGGLLAGGIFTIVFLPFALLIIAVAVVFSMYGKSSGRRTLPRDQPTATDLGTGTGHTNVASSPNSPGDLTDARRQAQ